MIFKPTLIANTIDIPTGLLKGIYTRWGGVIRVAHGQPGAGQIVGMLSDTSPFDQPLSLMKIITNNNGKLISQNLFGNDFSALSGQMSQLLNITGIGAAASVINVGISAVGFYIMNKKLNRLQESMSDLQRITEAGFQSVEKRMDDIQSQLVELRIFTLQNQSLLRDVLIGVYDVKNALFFEQMANLQIAMDHLSRFQNLSESEALLYLDRVSHVRLSIEGELNGRFLDIDNNPWRFLDSLKLYRGWAIAGAGEVYSRRRMRDLDGSAELAGQLGVRARSWAGRWAENLIPEREIAGIERFGHTRFNLTEGEKAILFRIDKGEDINQGEQRSLEIEGAHAVAKHLPEFNDKWFNRQRGIADTLGMIEETTERIESMGFEARYCAQNRLGFQQWEEIHNNPQK